MVIQNKIFSFKIKRQAKNVFPSDVERTVISCLFAGCVDNQVFKTPSVEERKLRSDKADTHSDLGLRREHKF